MFMVEHARETRASKRHSRSSTIVACVDWERLAGRLCYIGYRAEFMLLYMVGALEVAGTCYELHLRWRLSEIDEQGA
jgi:hypothetical protein